MFRPVVPAERLLNRLDGLLASNIAVNGEDLRVADTFNDGPDNLHPRDACDITDNVVELDVHLHQRLLHVLNVRGSVLRRAVAVVIASVDTQNRPVGRHLKTGHEGVGAQDVDAAGGAVVPLASMTNILSDDKRQEVLALGRLGWTLRRIQQATGVRRETASAYLKAAGLAVRPPGAVGPPLRQNRP